MMKKKTFLITLCGVLALSSLGCSQIQWVEGDFVFYPVNKHCHPFRADGSYYPSSMRVSKQYQKLHIKEMSYEWEGKGKGNVGIFLKDEVLDSLYTNNNKYKSNFYNPITDEYTYELYGISTRVRENVDIDTFFKGKKRGDQFKYTVKIVYVLDDEPESTQVIDYNVKMIMGKYVTSLFKTISCILVPMYM